MVDQKGFFGGKFCGARRVWLELMPNENPSFARTPEPPYYAVVFTSQRADADRGYGEMAERMVELASKQPGFLGVETVRGADGFGVTISYWADEESIAAWKAHPGHQPAQEAGKSVWYEDYMMRVAKVERAYSKSSTR
jgi:heme-degrading monooxygenase HmoA